MALQPARVDGGAGRGLLSGGPLKPFSYPQFRLYWAASLCSVMPFVMGMAARGWLVLVETESPFMVTAAQAVLLLPMALLTPFGGVIADRLNRKMVLLAGDVANLLVLVVMAVLLFLDVHPGVANLPPRLPQRHSILHVMARQSNRGQRFGRPRRRGQGSGDIHHYLQHLPAIGSGAGGLSYGH